MASTGPPHLTQEELSPGDLAILAGIKDWLSRADFDADYVCTDKELANIWASSLCKLEFIKKVNHKRHRPSSMITNLNLVHSATVFPNQTGTSFVTSNNL